MPVFHPLDDQVLVRRLAAVEQHGRLHIPDRAQERPLEGVVVATGPGRLVPGLDTALVADLEQTIRPPGHQDEDDRRWSLLVRLLRSALGERRVPLQVRAGDRVLFGKYAGTDLKFDGHDCIVIREADVLGVVADDVVVGPDRPRAADGARDLRAAIRRGELVETNLDREVDG